MQRVIEIADRHRRAGHIPSPSGEGIRHACVHDGWGSRNLSHLSQCLLLNPDQSCAARFGARGRREPDQSSLLRADRRGSRESWAK